MGHGWQPLWIFAGVALLVGGVSLALEAKARHGSVRALGRAVPVGYSFFVIVAVLGLVSTPVIGGRPVLNTSELARLSSFSETMVERLYVLGEIDAILELDQVQGRLKITELEKHYIEVEKWVLEYSSIAPDQLAVDELAGPHLSMEHTVDQALAAIDHHLRWLKTGDPVAYRVALEHRQAMAHGVLQTGQLIAEVAAMYGVQLREHEGGLVE